MDEFDNKLIQQFNEKIFPSGSHNVCSKLTAIFMLCLGIGFLVSIFKISDIRIFLFLPFLLYLFLVAPIPVLFSDTVYINDKDKYFRIKNRKIMFDEIADITYHYGYINPFKYSVFATVFHLHLKNNEKVSFMVFYRGGDLRTISMLNELGFTEIMYNNK